MYPFTEIQELIDRLNEDIERFQTIIREAAMKQHGIAPADKTAKLRMLIKDSFFSERIKRILIAEVGVQYLGELVAMKKEDLLKYKGIGRKTYLTILNTIDTIGLQWEDKSFYN